MLRYSMTMRSYSCTYERKSAAWSRWYGSPRRAKKNGLSAAEIVHMGECLIAQVEMSVTSPAPQSEVGASTGGGTADCTCRKAACEQSLQ